MKNNFALIGLYKEKYLNLAKCSFLLYVEKDVAYKKLVEIEYHMVNFVKSNGSKHGL